MNQDIPSEMAAKLAWFLESWRSIELRIRNESTNHDAGRHGSSFEWYIETALRQRLYETRWQGVEPGQTDRKGAYSDGKRFAESSWADGQQEILIYTKSFANEDASAHSWRPTPLTFFYLQHEPLTKALPKAEYLGRDKRLGRDCEVLILKNVRWSYSPVDIVYHLDRETALPLEVRCFDAGADRATANPQWYWVAKSFDRVQDGRYFPLRSADAVYGPAEGGGERIIQSREIQVESIQFNKEYAESIFRPVEEPGTPVLDNVTNKEYVVPGTKKPAEAPAKTAAPAAEPIRAERPAEWTSTLSTVGLVVGAALIASGVLAWWRRR